MTTRFVLIGSGNIASTYARACRNLECAEIVAVVSRNETRAKSFALDHKIPEIAKGLDEVKGAHDAIIVATPNGLHHAPVLTAAERGLHALVEKPLDITHDHMTAMIEACQKHNVRLGCSYQRRTRPDNQSVQRLLAEGALGTLYGVELTVKAFRDQTYYDSAAWRGTQEMDGGGPFMQQGSHDLDLLTWFFGLPESVTARTGTFAHTGIGVEDHGAALLTFPGGAIGTITASTIIKPGFNPRLEIYTEKGTVAMENDAIVTWEVDEVENPATPAVEESHSSGRSASVSDTSGHEAILFDFCDAVMNGRDPLVSGEEARKATDLILAIYESARTRKEVILSS
ncbi:MAG: Gfo/Idh/MocA family protein [Planctomycetota bacterium]|jgi:predicted dehydrogenase